MMPQKRMSDLIDEAKQLVAIFCFAPYRKKEFSITIGNQKLAIGNRATG